MAISKVSFFKTPQAADDYYYWTEDTLQQDAKVYSTSTGYLTLDVMANDLGGNAKTLYSIDDGNGNPINPIDLFNVDSLNGSGISAWEATADGNRARINNGKVEFDLSNELPGGVNSLGAGDQFTDTFIYAIRLGNGTLSWAHVHITIDGANDSATITASDKEETSVVEAGGVANGTPGDPDASGKLTVSDADAGENKFKTPASLEGTYGTFKFDADTGVWSYSLNQGKADVLFDGEGASDSLNVTSLDGTASYEIKVDITGSNDAPLAKDDTDSATEDGAIVNGSVATNDSDVDAGAKLTYTLDAPVAGLTLNDDGTYSFDPSDAAYQHLAAGKPVDVIANYTVTDDKGATDAGTLTITITGINDAPTITSNDGGDEASISIVENSSAVTTVMADDPDDGATVEYKISGGADSALFAIDKDTGALSFIAAPNFESPGDDGKDNVYDVAVQAWDGTDGDIQLLHVTVTDVNEQPSAGADFAVKADEDVSDTAVLATVAGTDPDLGGGNDGDNDFENLEYAIAPGGDPSGLFEVDAATGEISLKAGASFDFETTQSYVVTVRVSDGPGLFDDTKVTINVTDVNEQPSAGADFAVKADEDVSDTAVLATVAGTDPDLGGGNDGDNDFENLKYTIAPGGDPSGLFEVDPATGEISLKTGAVFDFEAAQSYVVTVRVSDGPGLFDDTKITINVTDINEGPSAGADFAVKANEDVSDTAVLATVLGSDPDLGGGNDDDNDFENLKYAIAPGGDPSGLFEIDPATGEISLASGKSLDFETAQSHVVTIRVTDGGGLFDDTKVTINVTDVNEQPSAGADFAVSAKEDVSSAAVLATVVGSDPDLGGGNDGANDFENLSYAIAPGGDPSGLFEIDPLTGEVSLKTGAQLDFEAAQSHVVTIRVSDGGGLFDEVKVSVDVVDVNEAPTLTVDATPVSVAENALAGTVIGDVDGTDPDLGGGNDGANDFENLKYSIVSVDGFTSGAIYSLFAIDGTTGTVTLAGALDYETDASYSLVIKVADGPGLFAQQTLVVNVTDVAEADPNDNDNDGLATKSTAGNGDNAANTLFGTAGGDDINGNGGNDTIYGGAGNDTLNGNNDSDSIFGGSGNDAIDGGGGLDTIYGGSGNDQITGQTDSDTIFGGSGDDTINGGGGTAADVLIGGYGADSLTGAGGSDTFKYLSTLDAGDIITDFDGVGGTGNQDYIDLDGLFDALGVLAAARAGRVDVSTGGSDGGGTFSNLRIDADGNGSFELTLAKVYTTDALTAGHEAIPNNFDIQVGT